MSAYFSVISYPREDSSGVVINLQDSTEQTLISEGLRKLYMTGMSDPSRTLRKIKSWSIEYNGAYDVWTKLPHLYRCSEFGEIRYIPADDAAYYLGVVADLIEDSEGESFELSQVGTSELGMLLELQQVLRGLSEQKNRYILFSWGR